MKVFTVIIAFFALPTVLTVSGFRSGYYEFNDTSVLLLDGRVKYYNTMRVNFYDSLKNYITNFRWYKNYLYLDSCTNVNLPSSSGLRVSSTTQVLPVKIRIYKNSTTFMVLANNKTVFTVRDTCSSVLEKKVKYISFSGDNSISAFQIDSVKCVSGFITFNGTLQCNICPRNSYSQNRKCISCPAVLTSPEGSQSYSDCMLKPCDPGYFLTTNGTCTICPNGTYSIRGQVLCNQCPDGKTSPEGSSRNKDCKACPPGYAFNKNTRTCSPCLNGTYTDRTRGFGCFPCPLGRTSKPAATSHSQCYWKCKPGEINSGEDCLKCPENTYSGGKGETKCHKCPKKKHSPAGSSKKKHCKTTSKN